MSIDERNPADAEYSIDLALTSASMMLEGGASAASVVMAMQDVAAAAGLDDVTADVNHSILTISEHGTAHVGATAISSRTYDFGRLRDTTRIVDDLCAGRIGVATANDRVHQVADADLVVTISALVVNIVLAWAHGTLTRRGWPLFFAQFIAGVVAVAVAATVATVHAHTDTSLTVTSVIVLLLPGVAFIGGVKDAISGWYLTAVARLTEAVTSIAGLIIGIQFALAAAAYFGVELDVKPPAVINLAPTVSTLMAAGGIALFFGIVSGNSPKTLVGTDGLVIGRADDLYPGAGFPSRQSLGHHGGRGDDRCVGIGDRQARSHPDSCHHHACDVAAASGNHAVPRNVRRW